MQEIKIVESEFDEWANSTPLLYASTSVRKRNLSLRLCFYAYIVAGYKVTLGDKTLYHGLTFDKAAACFNSAVEQKDDD